LLFTTAQLLLIKYYVRLFEEMSNKSQNTKLDNSTYNVLSALGRESDFLYSTVDKYIQDAQNDGNTQLVDLWNQIKQDKQAHLSKLMECLKKEVKNE
jgi:site-specific DNA-adenine methylase